MVAMVGYWKPTQQLEYSYQELGRLLQLVMVWGKFPKAPKKAPVNKSSPCNRHEPFRNKATRQEEHRNCGRFFQNELSQLANVSQLANYGHVMTKIMCMSSEVSSLHPAGLII